eukprot:2558558-Alexandrium_andersonii.AAC.1
MGVHWSVSYDARDVPCAVCFVRDLVGPMAGLILHAYFSGRRRIFHRAAISYGGVGTVWPRLAD